LQAGQKASQGNFQGAIADYSQAIKVKPNYSAAYSNRGIVRSALDDPEGAMADFNRAIDLNPMFPEFFVGRGLLRSRLKDRQGAIADYSQAIQISPTYALAYYNRGVVHYNLGNQQQAATDLRKAADLYLAQGNRDEYQRAIETLAIAGKTCRQSIRTMCDW
jgi:tetratricopeptide (TPR) repeat protein